MDRAPGSGARAHQPGQVVRRQQVEERRGGDESRVGELVPDELTIALTQACDSAIAAASDLGSPADLKLTYFATDRALVVDVDLMPSGTATLRAPKPDAEADQELQRLAYEMIRCFVDDFRPQVEPTTGHVSFRMVKYLAG